jgi:hypothetical protein
VRGKPTTSTPKQIEAVLREFKRGDAITVIARRHKIPEIRVRRIVLRDDPKAFEKRRETKRWQRAGNEWRRKDARDTRESIKTRQREKVLKLLAEKPVRRVAKILGWSYERVWAYAKRYQVGLARPKKQDRNAKMIEALKSGATIHEVAKRFKVGLSTARDVTREFRLSQIQK